MALEKTITAADQALSQVITEALPTIGAAVGFLKAEVTDVVHQLLVWKLMYHISVGMLLLVAAAIPLGIIFVYCKRSINLAKNGVDTAIWEAVQMRSESGDYWRPVFTTNSESGIAGAVLFLGLILVGIASGLAVDAISSFLTAIQIWVAPKIYLIEYAATLYQGK